jgi:hypothetical protein
MAISNRREGEMAEKASDRTTELTNPEDTRRIEDALRRHGIDPARAVEQRNWDAQGDAVRRLLDIAGELLPADEYRRLLDEMGRG